MLVLFNSSYAQNRAFAAKPNANTIIFSVEYDEGNPSYFRDDLPLKKVRPSKASASSTLASKTHVYAAKNAADGDASTAWCKGVAGNGYGEWLLYEYDKPVSVTVLEFKPFYAKNNDTLLNNNRIKKMKIDMEGLSGVAEFSDAEWCNDCQLPYPAPLINFMEGFSKQPVKTRWIRFTILEVFSGRKFNDTCISEIGVQAWNRK